ncbi:MAG: MBL fold metallo-hydrolase [Clostridia bacterium]|nr:MAG: MBL fold metallo-hydrolase [Clostridia bacterium]
MIQLTFLGSGGARVMLASQLLATGGLWFDLDGTRISLDPGPGALVHAKKKKLNPTSLDAIMLSHRHLDHCGDVNAMIEAMTQGGIRKKGTVYAPHDALEEDPVVLHYLRPYVDEIIRLEERQTYRLGDLTFATSMRHHHGAVETYGFNFMLAGHTVSYIPDTAYFPELANFYRGDILVISVLLLESNVRIPHLAVPEAREIIAAVKPQTAILTHFGLHVWQARPWEIAARLQEDTGIKVIAARDGMTFTVAE